MGDLNGKTALVTGSSRGIGRGIAQRLAKDGALIAVHYGSNDVAAKETVESITSAGGRAFPSAPNWGSPVMSKPSSLPSTPNSPPAVRNPASTSSSTTRRSTSPRASMR